MAVVLACATPLPSRGEQDSAGDVATATALSGRTMGTTYHVKFWRRNAAHRASEAGDSPKRGDALEIQAAIDKLLAEIDVQMSTYREDSELMRFNRAPADEWFPVSKPTARVVSAALRYSAMTGGAQDVTVQPLVALWGLGAKSNPHGRLLAIPSDAQLRQVMQVVGARHVSVRKDPPALRKDAAGVQIDLSSIAPGFAVDQIAETIAARGVEDAMIELGGEVRAAGVRPDGKPWRIGVESPWFNEKPVARAIPLENLALATSGDYRHFVVIDGNRYAHIIDPRTGQPLPVRGFAVTVVAPTCMEADGIATALAVFGFDDGYQWCLEHHTGALFQIRGDRPGEVRERQTPRYRALVPPEP